MQRRERTDVNVAFMQQLGFPTLELTVPARGTRPGTRATGKAPQKKASCSFNSKQASLGEE